MSAVQSLAVTFGEVLAGVRDIAVAGAAVTTAIVAVWGIRRWLDELSGKANYDLARSILRVVFRQREHLLELRFGEGMYPLLPPSMTSSSSSEDITESEAEAKYYDSILRRISDTHAELCANMTEAATLWGDALCSPFNALYECVREARLHTRRYLRHQSDLIELNDEELAEVVAYLHPDSERPATDKWDEALKAAVADFEAPLKKYLGRKRKS